MVRFVTTSTIGTYRRLYEEGPDEALEGGAEVWYHRAQNMVCVYVKGPAGATYRRKANPDEAFVWALFHPLIVISGDESRDIQAGSLIILPPGDSTITLPDGGDTWIGFTSEAEDLVARCPNRIEYEPRVDNIAPIEAWPESQDGYKLRVYNLDETEEHCYRHRTAMTRFTWPVRTQPRDPTSLSPHHHEDFEQASLIHSGTQVHHMRRSWSRNANEWLPDEHVVVAAPSIVISKPPDIHTTQAVSTDGPVGLIDFFAPPRWDFSSVAGLVVNGAEYPMPDEEPQSFARGASVYAANDPRAATERRDRAE